MATQAEASESSRTATSFAHPAAAASSIGTTPANITSNGAMHPTTSVKIVRPPSSSAVQGALPSVIPTIADDCSTIPVGAALNDKAFAATAPPKLDNGFMCIHPKCGDTFATSNQRTKHIKERHPGIAFECNLCNRTCQTSAGYRRHLESKMHAKFKNQLANKTLKPPMACKSAGVSRTKVTKPKVKGQESAVVTASHASNAMSNNLSGSVTPAYYGPPFSVGRDWTSQLPIAPIALLHSQSSSVSPSPRLSGVIDSGWSAPVAGGFPGNVGFGGDVTAFDRGMPLIGMSDRIGLLEAELFSKNRAIEYFVTQLAIQHSATIGAIVAQLPSFIRAAVPPDLYIPSPTRYVQCTTTPFSGGGCSSMMPDDYGYGNFTPSSDLSNGTTNEVAVIQNDTGECNDDRSSDPMLSFELDSPTAVAAEIASAMQSCTGDNQRSSDGGDLSPACSTLSADQRPRRPSAPPPAAIETGQSI